MGRAQQPAASADNSACCRTKHIPRRVTRLRRQAVRCAQRDTRRRLLFGSPVVTLSALVAVSGATRPTSRRRARQTPTVVAPAAPKRQGPMQSPSRGCCPSGRGGKTEHSARFLRCGAMYLIRLLSYTRAHCERLRPHRHSRRTHKRGTQTRLRGHAPSGHASGLQVHDIKCPATHRRDRRQSRARRRDDTKHARPVPPHVAGLPSAEDHGARRPLKV